MSHQVNTENPDDQDEEPSNLSETSSTSTCTSSDTTTTLTTSSTSSSSSNSSSSDSSTTEATTERINIDGDTSNQQRHRLCQDFRGLSQDLNQHSRQDSSESKHDLTFKQDDSKSVGQQCDSETLTRCPDSSKSESPTNFGEKNEKLSCKYSSVSNQSKGLSLTTNLHQQLKQTDKQLGISKETQDTQSLPNQPPILRSTINVDEQDSNHNLLLSGTTSSTNSTSPAPSYSNFSSTIPTTREILRCQLERSLRSAPSPSPSLSIIDTNNNKNNNLSTTNTNESGSRDGIFSTKRTNFSKSASGSRLISKSRPSVCDCLSQDCNEKKHSNRRQFIEHYYNSRTQLPRANTSTSSFNISTPLNRLSECDAITRRLLSSPIRATNTIESPTRRAQVSEVDKSRRASLGTNSFTDRVFVFSSNPFRSLELSYRKNLKANDSQRRLESENSHSSVENDVKLKQQGRSLSICDEETMNPRHRGTSSNYSPSLNRAISLACDSGSSSTARRLLTIIPLFGCDIKSLEQLYKLGLILPPVIESAVDHLLVNGINSIGIFRKSGVKSRIITLKQRIETNQNIKFNEISQNNEFSIYDVADLVKMWFRELKPLPLLTKELIKVISTFLNSSEHYIKANVLNRDNSSQETRTSSSGSEISTAKYVDPVLRGKINSITSPTHKALLSRALDFLAQISSRCDANQMTSQNLAICLTPSLCATESDQSSILLAQKALEYCIDNHKILFC